MLFWEKNKSLIITLAVVLIGVMIFAGNYNGMISSQQEMKAKWSQVENHMQRRADLIPNLAEVVKGYANHEKEVLTNLEKAVASFKGATTMPQMTAASNQMSMGLASVIALAEKYPDLKADKHFTDLMTEIAGTENRLTIARKDYNEYVQIYNNKILRFPGSIIANISGFREAEYFEAEDTAKTAPKIKF